MKRGSVNKKQKKSEAVIIENEGAAIESPLD